MLPMRIKVGFVTFLSCLVLMLELFAPAGRTLASTHLAAHPSVSPRRQPVPPTLLFRCGPVKLRSTATSVDVFSSLNILPTGAYTFNGRFHNNGYWTQKASFVWLVRDSSGTAYEFAHKGDVSGKLAFWGSKDHKWNLSGTNEALAAGWDKLIGPGHSGRCRTSAAFYFPSISEMVDFLKKAMPIITTIITIVSAA